MTTTKTTKYIDLEVGPMDKMMIFGGSGRIADIIGKAGYKKLVRILEVGDTDKLETLQMFIGWSLEYLQERDLWPTEEGMTSEQ